MILFLPDKDPMLLTIYRVDHPLLGILAYGIYFAIPVGISFYTFQTLSYTLDVYHGRVSPEYNLGKFALFVSFFPQLVAGPIERFSHLMPQLRSAVAFRYANFSRAFRLMLFGFFLKICIADNFSGLVDAVYADPRNFDLFSRWLATLGFSFQIYTDFAGYTLVAQGAALCLGVELMDNFRTPYLSTSISEFWKRWHISLSTWFRDYLYLPLGGNRVSRLRWVVNILLVFAISGFWHGANWTFLIWGCIHGGLYLLERFVWGKPGAEAGPIVRFAHGLRTFVLVQVAWVFFRADTTPHAMEHLHLLFASPGPEQLAVKGVWIVLFAAFVLSELWLYRSRFDRAVADWHPLVRWSLYAFLLYAITALGGVANHPFIYFQF
ncbi:MAG: MBOAT family protein [Flavobacteriales bacterium]|nr:MBOAT family protein [Flavobacteriales bacterium]